jgi:hypothetical protein
MNKNVGLVVIPYEYLRGLGITPEDVKGRLILPDGVKVFEWYEDFYRLTFNIMLISDKPVDGVTFPTAPGYHARETTYKLTPDGKFKIGV